MRDGFAGLEGYGSPLIPLLGVFPFVFRIGAAVHRPFEHPFGRLAARRGFAALIKRAEGLERRVRAVFGDDDQRRSLATQSRDLQIAAVLADVRIEKRAGLMR